MYSGYLLSLEKQRFIGREAKTCKTVEFGEVSLGFVPGYGTTPSVLMGSQPPTLETNKDFHGAQQEFYFCLLLTRIPFTPGFAALCSSPHCYNPCKSLNLLPPRSPGLQLYSKLSSAASWGLFPSSAPL